MTSWLLGGTTLVVLAIAMVPIVVTWIESRQAQTVGQLEPVAVSGTISHHTAVVIYFSRSGNTALAARHLANQLHAPIVELKATDYELGLSGWVHAMKDARGHHATITPNTIDLSGVDTVYLGSPIWLYSPAPPIWEFVRANRLDGKAVVLFNTFNSTFEQHFIDEFRDLVIAQGARSFEHRAVKRGRMGQQMSPDRMLQTIDTQWMLVPLTQ